MKAEEILNEALRVLRDGGTILYPTDTVWGLGCDATNPAAVARIFEIKRRADSKSLVLLACDLDMVAKYVKEVPSIAIDLVEVNDAPMTIIYPEAVAGSADTAGDRWHLAHNCVAEDGSVGIRIPLMEWCKQLVYKLGRPIVSTSANISFLRHSAGDQGCRGLCGTPVRGHGIYRQGLPDPQSGPSRGNRDYKEVSYGYQNW